MSIPEIVKTLPAEAAFLLGRVVTAHDNRRHYREKAKLAQGEFEGAKRDLNAYGMFDDCGPSYEASYSEAKGNLSAARQHKISVERYYKKLKHEFLEAFPEHATALESLIPGATDHLE